MFTMRSMVSDRNCVAMVIWSLKADVSKVRRLVHGAIGKLMVPKKADARDSFPSG
jgi:hypothetical protein